MTVRPVNVRSISQLSIPKKSKCNTTHGVLVGFLTAPKPNEGSASPSTRAKRRAHRRLTRNESRYHSGLNQFSISIICS